MSWQHLTDVFKLFTRCPKGLQSNTTSTYEISVAGSCCTMTPQIFYGADDESLFYLKLKRYTKQWLQGKKGEKNNKTVSCLQNYCGRATVIGCLEWGTRVIPHTRLHEDGCVPGCFDNAPYYSITCTPWHHHPQ